jgi:hypothetical protein
LSDAASKGAEWSADEKWMDGGGRVDDTLEQLQQTRVQIQKNKQTNSRNIQRTTNGNRTETGRKVDGKWTEACRPQVYCWTGSPSKRFLLDGVAVHVLRPLSVHFPSTFRPLSVRLVRMGIVITLELFFHSSGVYELPMVTRKVIIPPNVHPPYFELY